MKFIEFVRNTLIASLLVISPYAAQTTRTNYANALLPNDRANMPFRLTNYGQPLVRGKAALHNGFRVCNTSLPHRALILSMGMIETNTLNTADRDRSKDNRTDGSANVSLFNLNVDMVVRLGYRRPWDLNDPRRIPDAVCLIQRAIRRWGLIRTLNYVRGGYTAFMDGRSYGAGDYRRTVKTTLAAIDRDSRLMRDGRRVEIMLPHV